MVFIFWRYWLESTIFLWFLMVISQIIFNIRIFSWWYQKLMAFWLIFSVNWGCKPNFQGNDIQNCLKFCGYYPTFMQSWRPRFSCNFRVPFYGIISDYFRYIYHNQLFVADNMGGAFFGRWGAASLHLNFTWFAIA